MAIPIVFKNDMLICWLVLFLNFEARIISNLEKLNLTRRYISAISKLKRVKFLSKWRGNEKNKGLIPFLRKFRPLNPN